jgi:hypothetical protein
MPVIPATQETEAKRSWFEASLGKVRDSISKTKYKHKIWGMA